MNLERGNVFPSYNLVLSDEIAFLARRTAQALAELIAHGR